MALPAGATPAPPPSPTVSRFSTLSIRQREVCDLILAGKTDQEIAYALGLAIQTVKNHATAMYDKLGIGGFGSGRAGPGRLALARLSLDQAREQGKDIGYATGYRHGYVDGLVKGRKEGKAAALLAASAGRAS